MTPMLLTCERIGTSALILQCPRPSARSLPRGDPGCCCEWCVAARRRCWPVPVLAIGVGLLVPRPGR